MVPGAETGNGLSKGTRNAAIFFLGERGDTILVFPALRAIPAPTHTGSFPSQTGRRAGRLPFAN